MERIFILKIGIFIPSFGSLIGGKEIYILMSFTKIPIIPMFFPLKFPYSFFY